MSMALVKQIMKDGGSGYFATTNGDRPEIRPMGSPTWVEGELWLACGLNSDKVRDIRKKPRVAFCIADHQWQHVRISGTCTVSTERADRETFLRLVPATKDYFDGADDPNFAVLRTKVDRVRLMTRDSLEYVEVEPETVCREATGARSSPS